MIKRVCFENDHSSLFQPSLYLRDEAPFEKIEIRDQVIFIRLDGIRVKIGEECSDLDSHVPGQPARLFQSLFRDIDGIHSAPMPGEKDGVSPFPGGHVQNPSLREEPEVSLQEGIRFPAESIILLLEPLIPSFPVAC